MNCSKILTTFHLNGKPYKDKPVSQKSSLAELRVIMDLEDDIIFLHNDLPLDIQDESNICL